MGVDLKLLPLDTNEDWDWGFSQTILSLERRSELFDKIRELPVITKDKFKFSSYLAQIPDGSWQGDNGYGLIESTPYGEPLTWVRAKQLAEVMEKWYSEQEDWAEYDYRNKAVIAYLKALHENNLVALYWH